MSQRTCTLADCATIHFAKGFCRKHYMAKRYQDNIEEERAKRVEWRAKNVDYMKTYNATYYEFHSETIKAKAREWMAANPERKKANDAAWCEKNREYKNGMDRLRWHADPERSKRVHATWYRRNKHKAKEAWHRRRARKLGATVGKVSLKAILAEHGMVCHICGGDIPDRSSLHFDHVIPLSKGGRHAADNIRPAHAFCNLSKGDKILTKD